MEPLLSDGEKNFFRDVVTTAPSTTQFIEYGTGGSTCMFAELMRDQQRLFTIEHNREWYDKVVEALKDIPGGRRVHMNLREPLDGRMMLRTMEDGTEIPIPESDFRPYSSPYEELPFGMESYIWAKDVWIDWPTVGLAFVDGVARGPVLAALRGRLLPGRLVMLHDYPGREVWYDWAVRLYTRIGTYGGGLLLEVPKY